MAHPLIQDVSDTALWVAVYRAMESERPDALFRDRLAGRLAGERGRTIAAGMRGGRYTAWSVVIRTCIIDTYIQNLIAEGVDTVLNLGAGLDTRPYRLALPASLRWVEVDLPQIIRLKEEQLAGVASTCRLERISLDLSDDAARRSLFARLAAESGKLLVLTEGVVPYLSNEQVASLAQDLRGQKSVRFWILDYFSSEVIRFMQRRRNEQMRKAPFRFNPSDWFEFFARRGWRVREMRYLGEESVKLGRAVPIPWLMKVLRLLIPAGRQSAFQKALAYVLLEPEAADG